MKLEILRRVWALLGAALLLGIVQFAAAPAQAQSCSEEEQVVWELLDALGYALFVFDDEFDTNPSQKDCVNVCKKMTNGCRKLGSSFARDANTMIKTSLAAAGILCKTAVNRRDCKAGVTGARRMSRNMMRDMKADFKALCADPDLAASCSNACNHGEHPACCEEAFGGTCR
jgi:hypothetical protein